MQASPLHDLRDQGRSSHKGTSGRRARCQAEHPGWRWPPRNRAASGYAGDIGWPLPQVHDTIDALAAKLGGSSGLRLTRTATRVKLDIRPGTLDRNAEGRFAQLHRLRGPDPVVFHLLYRVVRGDRLRVDGLIKEAPDALREAFEAGILVEGRPPGLRPRRPEEEDDPEWSLPFDLAPDVAYSLGYTREPYE